MLPRHSQQRIFHRLCASLFALLGFVLALPALGQGFRVTLQMHSASLPVENAVVALYTKEKPPNAPATASMDQVANMFVPHVLAVQAGTLVSFPNSDDIRHQVYSFSAAKRFELRLYHGTTARPVLFDVAGKVVLGCNIHDSMLGYIYVLDTATFAISRAEGKVEFTLPAADYRLEIQHPQLAQALERDLKISADTQLDFDLGELLPDPRQQAPSSELEALFKK